MWETPVPIPNTTVKTQAADGTALETVWESRWPPDQKKNNRHKPDKKSLWKQASNSLFLKLVHLL